MMMFYTLYLSWGWSCRRRTDAKTVSVTFHLNVGSNQLRTLSVNPLLGRVWGRYQHPNVFGSRFINQKDFWKQASRTCWTPVSNLKRYGNRHPHWYPTPVSSLLYIWKPVPAFEAGASFQKNPDGETRVHLNVDAGSIIDCNEQAGVHPNHRF